MTSTKTNNFILSQFIAEYKSNSLRNTHSHSHQRQNLDFYKQRLSNTNTLYPVDFIDALKDSANYLNHRGKLHPHAHFLNTGKRKTARQKAEENLLLASAAIQGCQNFDSLHKLVDQSIRCIDGIGELLVYDAALHISANLNILPDKIYLHAAPLKSAKLLLGNQKIPKIGTVHQLFPLYVNELSILAPYEIENFLCIYYTKLKGKLL